MTNNDHQNNLDIKKNADKNNSDDEDDGDNNSFLFNVNKACNLTQHLLNLDNHTCYFDQDQVIFSMHQMLTMLLSPVVCIFNPLSLFAYWQCNFYDVSTLPPVSETFCKQAVLCTSSMLQHLTTKFFHLFKPNTTLDIQTHRWIRVGAHNQISIELDTICDYFIVPVQTNTWRIWLTSTNTSSGLEQKWPIVGLQNMATHVMLCTRDNQFKDASLVIDNSESDLDCLYILFKIHEDLNDAVKKSTKKRKINVTTNDEQDELLAAISLKRAAISFSKRWKKMKRIRERIDFTNRFSDDEESQHRLDNYNSMLTSQQTDDSGGGDLDKKTIINTKTKKKEEEEEQEYTQNEQEQNDDDVVDDVDTVEDFLNQEAVDDDDDDDATTAEISDDMYDDDEDTSVEIDQTNAILISEPMFYVAADVPYASEHFTCIAAAAATVTTDQVFNQTLFKNQFSSMLFYCRQRYGIRKISIVKTNNSFVNRFIEQTIEQILTEEENANDTTNDDTRNVKDTESKNVNINSQSIILNMSNCKCYELPSCDFWQKKDKAEKAKESDKNNLSSGLLVFPHYLDGIIVPMHPHLVVVRVFECEIDSIPLLNSTLMDDL